MYKIQSIRHQKALEYALNQIYQSSLFTYTTGIWLFGSCARNEQKYESDIDLLMQLDLSEDDLYEMHNEVIYLKGIVAPTKISDPDVDLKITVNPNWQQDKSLFYQEIRKDGIRIWPEH